MLFLLVVVVLWAAFVHFDKERIRLHFHDSGSVIMSIRWCPFNHGWASDDLRFGDGNRIYQVQHRDVEGNLRQVRCKTSMLNGVALDSDKSITVVTDSTTSTH